MNQAQDQTTARQEKFIELRAGGDSYRTIAKKLKVSRGTLARWESELGDRVAETRRDRLEAVYNEYGLLKEYRIKSLGEQLKRIEGELGRRELADVPTDKLLDFLLKYRAALKDEYTPLNTGERESLTQSINESVEILTTRIKSGELEQSSLKAETTSLLSLIKAREALPCEQDDDKKTLVIRTHRIDDLDMKLSRWEKLAQNLNMPERDELVGAIKELKEMKRTIDEATDPEEPLIVNLEEKA